MLRVGKNKRILILFAIIFVVTGGFLMKDKMFTSLVKNAPSSALSHLPVEWKTFTNTRFGYSVEYSSLVQIMSGTDGADPQTDSTVDFFIPGESRFTVGVVRPSDYQKYLKEHSFTTPKDRKSYEQIVNHISSDLKTYTETIYQYQLSDPNSAIKNKQVGPLEETAVDGQKAYQFTLTGSFAFDATGRTGYTIGDKPNMYVIIESPWGDKFIIHYLVGDPISEKMFHSFKFVR